MNKLIVNILLRILFLLVPFLVLGAAWLLSGCQFNYFDGTCNGVFIFITVLYEIAAIALSGYAVDQFYAK